MRRRSADHDSAAFLLVICGSHPSFASPSTHRAETQLGDGRTVIYRSRSHQRRCRRRLLSPSPENSSDINCLECQSNKSRTVMVRSSQHFVIGSGLKCALPSSYSLRSPNAFARGSKRDMVGANLDLATLSVIFRVTNSLRERFHG